MPCDVCRLRRRAALWNLQRLYAHRAAQLRVELAAVAARRLGDGQLPQPALAVQQRVGYQALLCMDLHIQA